MTTSALPKKQNGDFSNNPMVVLNCNGDLVGWGDSQTGALANGFISGNIQAAPAQRVVFDPNTTLPPSTATIVDWAFTNSNLYVVFSNGWVYSAGQNSEGQLGHGDTSARPQLKRIEFFVTNSKTITNVWACSARGISDSGCCVYFQASDFNMYGCGANAAGNLGNASTPTSNVSTPAACSGIGTSPHVVDVQIAPVASNFSAYMLFSDGSLKVAGLNGQGQLGTGNTTNVTGSFVSSTVNGGSNVSTFAAISCTGGNTSTVAGCAIAVDTSGNVWSTGRNNSGQLGLGDTTDRNRFTQTSLTNIAKAEVGGGGVAYGYAISQSGTLYTWGHNGRNNLFKNNSTTPQSTPASVSAIPGTPAKIFLPKGENTGTNNAQMIILTTSGLLAFAGDALGQQSIASVTNAGAYSFIATPRQILDGSETIVDLYAHGTGAAQRWFILTDAGNLYACGDNSNAVCTGGISSSTVAPTTEFFRLNFCD